MVALTCRAFNKHGDIVKANKTTAVLFGYSMEEFYATKRKSLVDVNDKAISSFGIVKCYNGNRKGEITAIKKNAVHFLMEFFAALMVGLNGDEFATRS